VAAGATWALFSNSRKVGCRSQKATLCFDGGTGPLPAHLVEEAERLFEELIVSMDEATLLHGDLHHDNILAAERQPWLALDPKGLVGEPA